MAYNLFDLSYRVAAELHVAFEGTATGGGTTTLIDTLWLSSYNNDHFNRGTVWVLYDAGGAAAAPQGEYGRVSDFDKATSTATIASALTAAIAAGDRYAIANEEYPLDIIIQCINQVLSELWIKVVDTTSIVLAQGQTEYSLPTAVLDENIEVSIQNNADTNDNQWVETSDWYIQETAIGTAKKLMFRHMPDVSNAVKIVYYIPHTSLRIRTDKLMEGINVNRVVLDAAYRCLIWKLGQKGQSDALLNTRIQELSGRVERIKWQETRSRRKIKLASLGW